MAHENNITEANRLLWKAFKKGNKQAFSHIFKSYYNDLYYYGMKLVGNEDMVKDDLQNLFAELWERRQNLGEINHIKAYLIKSFRRRLLKTTTKARKNIIIEIKDTQDLKFELSIEEFLIQQENQSIDIKKLKNSLESLNKTQKEIIYLKYYNNLDYKEIAEITGLKYQSVRNSMHKALKVLRAAF